MRNKTINTRSLILAIISLPQLSKKLMDQGKLYNDTLRGLLKYDYYDEDMDLPTISYLCNEIGMNPAKFMKQLQLIFEDLKELIRKYQDIAIDIKEFKYSVFVKGYCKNISFSAYFNF